jgi:hypothetical protein
MAHPEPTLPNSVRLAALLLVAYGVFVVVMQSSAGWEASRDFPRALLRLAGCGVIASGLMQARRWAWWATVVLGAFWAVTGVAAVALVSAAGAWDRMGASMPVLLLGRVGLLAVAVALLLQPASREAFR